jgi:hypothetical protein
VGCAQGLVGAGDLDVARSHEGGVARGGIGERRAGEGLELLDVELVVREEDVVLEVVRRVAV